MLHLKNDASAKKPKFWLLRGLTWMLFVGGLAVALYGVLLGSIAFYATKNGFETERTIEALAQVLLAVVGGILMMAVGQVFRVVLAIEENTRQIAHQTRYRRRSAEPSVEEAPSAPALRERMRL